MQKQSPIHFFYECRPFSFRHRGHKKNFITQIFKKEGLSVVSLTYVFCSDKTLLQMNKQYLKHNYYTDILTFPFSGSGEPVSGEIYISIDRIKENARNLGVSFQEELNRVIFHGALHLCGYKDKNMAEKAKMREKENEYIQKLYTFLKTAR